MMAIQPGRSYHLPPEASDAWWQTAAFSQNYPRSFQDTNWLAQCGAMITLAPNESGLPELR